MITKEDRRDSEPPVVKPSRGSSGAAKEVKGAYIVRGRTGPRTVQGKEKSSQNSVKHGIFATAVVLPGESQAEFDALLRGLCEDFQPVGTFEDGLVEVLAVTRWRQRRLLIAEGAEIQAGRQFIDWDVKQAHLDEATGFRRVRSNDGLIRKIANPEALESCLYLLQVLKINVEAYGLNGNENAIAVLTTLYGNLNHMHWRNTLFATYQGYLMASEPEDGRKGKKLTKEESKSDFLSVLDGEITRLREYQLERSSVEAKRLKVESIRRSVPDSPRLDQLLRYSTTLERTFDRTLSQLERVQRMRRGQPVAPPLSVNVTS